MSGVETVLAWLIGGTSFLTPLGVYALMWRMGNKGG